MPLPTPPVPVESFWGPYRFLSNFFIEPDGTHVEGEYQAAKARSHKEHLEYLEKFRAMTPGECKRAGRKIPLRSDWDAVKLSVMYELVERKFLDHKDLANKLLATGSRKLIEGNSWGDTFWGVYIGKGENNLGKILMTVRALLVLESNGAEDQT